jgi:hypothetical protein
MCFIFSGANNLGNTNAQNQTNFHILINLTKLNIGDLLTQEKKHSITLPNKRHDPQKFLE